MLNQETDRRIRSAFYVLNVVAVQRVGDWLLRTCPACHQVGRVAIYANRESEALRFITRRGWVCRVCRDIDREVEDAFLSKGGE